MLLQKFRTNFFSSKLHDVGCETIPLLYWISIAFINFKLNILKFLLKRLATVMTTSSVLSSRPSFLDGSIVVEWSCTVLFIVAPLVVVFYWEVFLLLVRQFMATPSSTSWVWFCSTSFIHCVRFWFSLMVIELLLILVVILKLLARIHLHFLAHELLFTFLFFFSWWDW